MFQPLFKYIVLLSFLVGTAACHASPLLNHKNATDLVPLKEKPIANECTVLFFNNSVCMQIAWIKGPALKVENSFAVRVIDPSGKVVNPGSFAAELWMPSMGHGSSPTKITAQGDGQFLVESVHFIMPGAWELHLSLGIDGQVDEKSLPINL